MTGSTRRWTYHVLRPKGSLDTDQLDALGADGWELVSAVPDRDTGTPSLVFKRPAPDFRARITLDQRAAVTGSAEDTDR
ncbi:MAG: DUF4177 domain-containing protein [Chloroflexota bacterium]|nr:DUF4177 domain-containing protein [Chloroflexota bacterium]